MRQFTAEDLGLDVREIERGLAEHWSFPSHTYHRPEVYQFELEAVFSNRWQYFAPVEQLAQPGDVVIGQAGEIPIVVTRSEEGKLHGFVNICRHRGYQVVRATANCSRLVCGYHGWTYGLDGRLTYARDTDTDPTFRKDELSLIPVSVDQWAQAVFVNPDRQALSLRETHPRLEPLAEEGGFDTNPANYRLHREIVTHINANWKLWYDNGVECYHCPLIHGKSFGDAFNVDPNDYHYLLMDNISSSRTKPGVTRRGDGLHSQRYFPIQLFPGCQIVQIDDMMYMMGMVPTGPESCRFTTHYLAEQGADLDRVDAWVALFDQTFEEDRDAVEVQQRGLRTGRLPRMKYVGEREEPVLFFNALIWDAYKQALDSG